VKLREQTGPVADASERELVFVGPKVEYGRIDLRLLSESLGGFAALTERSSSILYGQTFEHTAELSSPLRAGSVVVPIEIVPHAVQVAAQTLEATKSLLLSPEVQALTNLCTLLGVGTISIAAGLFRMFKVKKGRLIDLRTDSPLLQKIDINIEVNRYVRLYNDGDIRSSLRRTLRPLREDGIDEFQTRRNGVIVERVTKSDLLAADEAEMSDIMGEEERWLDIQKVALVRHLAWHFAGDGATFDAKIEDEKFWKRIENGERFGSGDRLQVRLRTSASRDRNGRLHVEYLITEVLDVGHYLHISQGDIFQNDPRI
jgi:hypothetical protein